MYDRQCVKCGQIVSSSVKTCPTCKKAIPTPFANLKIVAIGAVAIGLLIGIRAAYVGVTSHFREQSAQAQRQAKRDKLSAAFLGVREELMRDAKAAFVEGRPEETVRIFGPYATVLDSEAHGIWKLASEQAKAKATMAAMEAEEKERQQAKEQELAAQAAKLDACRSDAQCWGDKHMLNAGTACAPEIERQAQYQAEWTSSFLTRFGQFRRGREPSSIVYLGDEVKFQNGFGAWRLMRYECEYDPESKRVLGVSVTPK